jgi:hypothetical protein
MRTHSSRDLGSRVLANAPLALNDNLMTDELMIVSLFSFSPQSYKPCLLHQNLTPVNHYRVIYQQQQAKV